MIAMKIPLRRGTIAAFWTVVVCVFAFTGAACAAVLGASLWWIWGLGAGILLLLPGLLWPPWLEYGVRAWNKGSRTLGATLRALTLRLCFYFVFLFVARPGSSFQLGLDSKRESMWKARAETSGGVWECPVPRTTARPRWLVELLRSTRQRGNRWMVVLAPFILTLMLLEGEDQEDTAPPASTYTLY
jgi:hypothetical protein